jgi:hypothetical protein
VPVTLPYEMLFIAVFASLSRGFEF